MSNGKEYYLIAKERLVKQLENVDMYNSKVNTLLITCGVLIAFLGEIASRKGLILALGLLPIIIAVCILLWAYRIGEWQDTPNPKYIYSELEKLTLEMEGFYKVATQDIVECYQKNNEDIDRKVKRINLSSLFLMLGIFFSIIGLVIYLFLLDP